jgi:hypothetical protein
VQVRRLPDAVAIALGNAAGEILAELRDSGDPLTKKTVESFVKARAALMEQTALTDEAFAQMRQLNYKYL